MAEFPLAYTLVYFGTIVVVAFWEGVAPRRAPSASLRRRWVSNLAILGIDTVVIRAAFPLLAVGLAVEVQARGWGLLPACEVPYALAFGIAFLALDLAKYVQHRLLHSVPTLWRLHRMHHTDPDYDFTTGLRFHPIEALFTTSVGLLIILALGAPVAAVIAHELGFVAVAMFVHGNLRFPRAIDRLARQIVVTPDMHRVHHSALTPETNSNFGSIMPWWDRLGGTYVSQPSAGHEAMTIGLAEFREPKHLQLGWMLANPWLPLSEVPIPKRRIRKMRRIDTAVATAAGTVLLPQAAHALAFTPAIPEPSAIGLFAAGLAAVVIAARFVRRR